MEERAFARLVARIHFHECDCWVWTGRLNRNGYGYFSLGGQMRLVHRVVYETVVEQIPDGLTLDHHCRLRSCVNPDHLEPVTRAENQRRGARFRGQPRPIAPGVLLAPPVRTHCRHGHRLDSENTYVRANGARDCRACTRVRVRERDRKKRRSDPAYVERKRESVRKWNRQHGATYQRRRRQAVQSLS